jgi:Cobalamin synthesis protein cobW C-terminal domain
VARCLQICQLLTSPLPLPLPPCLPAPLLCPHVQGYGNQRFVFQGVHETICYGPSDKPWGEGEARINQIVFIGRGLDRKALMEGFR